jgi:hypothetical protein
MESQDYSPLCSHNLVDRFFLKVHFCHLLTFRLPLTTGFRYILQTTSACDVGIQLASIIYDNFIIYYSFHFYFRLLYIVLFLFHMLYFFYLGKCLLLKKT